MAQTVWGLVRPNMNIRFVAMLVLMAMAPHGAAAGPVRSGGQLVEQCTGSSGEVRLGRSCVAYFESALDMLATLERYGELVPICLPQPIETGRIVELFVLESRIYPDVLEVRATDLIVGMLVKFFPCRAA